MSALHAIPELAALGAGKGLLRIPPEMDVPLTARVKALVDAAPFRRLARISQLGLVGLVYPAAQHTRFEHSLGVYRMALLFVRQLAGDDRFAAAVTPRAAESFLAAALLHDIGHWPFCHAIEDMKLAGLPEHENLARDFIVQGPLAEILRQHWKLDPATVADLVAGTPQTPAARLLASLLSGPIDIDKNDYLPRDSLHAGVPYGRNFDQQRLISALCLDEKGEGLALTDKGRTAAEMMVFARYVMFSEVYWHHAVRAATAMLQRAFFEVRDRLPSSDLFQLTEHPFVERLSSAAPPAVRGRLLDGLFGSTRQLYKRLAQFSFFEQPELYRRVARRPYAWLVRCARHLAAELSTPDAPLDPLDLLVDAPPQGLEVEFKVQIYYPKEGCYRSLGDVSPVVQTLASRQFDDFVKRVRVFVHPARRDALRGVPLNEAIARAADAADRGD